MNVRLSMLLVVVLALVGGSIGITLALRSEEPEILEPWLYKVNTEDIVGISVTHEGMRMDYALMGDRGDDWVITAETAKDGEETRVFPPLWGGKPLLLSGPRCSRAVEEQIEDPGQYGLTLPVTKITVITRSGFPLAFHMGDHTPDGQDQYARLVGSDRLCTLPSAYTDVVAKMATEPPYVPIPGSTPQAAEHEVEEDGSVSVPSN